ncbi:MAG: GrpB family protein [Acidobacteriota bacterium]
MARLEVVPYDRSWPARYEAEAERLRSALGSTLRVLEHVGSTSVPGLAAKPVVDVAASVEAFDDLDVGALEALGYRYVPKFEEELPNRRYFTRGDYHLHVYEQEHEEFMDYVRFRDYLRTHPEDAQAYGDLKLRLAAEHGDDRAGYQAAKAPFVARLVEILRRSEG